MLAATLSSGTRFSSWWMIAIPAFSASRTLAKRTGAPAIADLAVVVGLHAGQDLHQRRLAGAVLAHQRVHLAAAEVEADPGQRGHAGEALADAPRRQQRPGSARVLPAGHRAVASLPGSLLPGAPRTGMLG